MIFNIQQTKSNFNMQWEVADHFGRPIATISAPFEVGKFEVGVSYASGLRLGLYYNPQDKTWGSKLVDRLSFKIFDSNRNKIGHIVGKNKKLSFFKAYPYYEIEYNGEMYYGYEVGFGRKGLYLCIYKQDQLIGIIDKKLQTINFKDTYTLYLEQPEYAEVPLLFSIYYDMTKYGDVMEVALHSAKEVWVNTPYKDLIEKYDPTYIARVKAMDGIIEE